MSLFEIVLLIVIGYICVFTIIDRICKCVEQCAVGKSYQEFVKSNAAKELPKEEK